MEHLSHLRGEEWISHAEISDRVAEELGISPGDARAIFRALVCVIFEALLVEDEVDIPGFGKFYIFFRPGRRIAHPKTREEMHTQDRHIVKFRPAWKLRQEVGEPPDEEF